jgi:hypothetical protein
MLRATLQLLPQLILRLILYWMARAAFLAKRAKSSTC